MGNPKADEEEEAVQELTDKAIDVEITKLERIIKTRDTQIGEIQEENAGYAERCAMLRRVKIARIEAQLPKDAE